MTPVSATRVVSDVVAFLAKVPLFVAFTPGELTTIAARLGQRRLRKGEVLIREGRRVDDDMYIVRRGGIVVSKAVTPGIEHVLERFGPGDFLGESGLFELGRHSVTIQAASATELLVLQPAVLDRLLHESPRAACSFFATVARECVARLHRSHELLGEVTRWGLEATGLELSKT